MLPDGDIENSNQKLSVANVTRNCYVSLMSSLEHPSDNSKFGEYKKRIRIGKPTEKIYFNSQRKEKFPKEKILIFRAEIENGMFIHFQSLSTRYL